MDNLIGKTLDGLYTVRELMDELVAEWRQNQ